MAEKKLEDLSIFSVEELNKKLIQLRKELMQLRFQKAAQQLPNFQKIKQTKRQIARILTEINKQRRGNGGKSSK